MCAEASIGLDLFSFFFVSRQKRTKRIRCKRPEQAHRISPCLADFSSPVFKSGDSSFVHCLFTLSSTLLKLSCVKKSAVLASQNCFFGQWMSLKQRIKLSLKTSARRLGRKAGWCVGVCVEAFFGLDLFSFFFVSRQKRTKRIRCKHPAQAHRISPCLADLFTRFQIRRFFVHVLRFTSTSSLLKLSHVKSH
jgi:hypothetical protein